LLVTIKPHSSFSSYFLEKQYVADFSTYNDLLFYLNGMHKRFINYLRIQKSQGIEESFVILDKNLKIINPEELSIKRAKDGDIFHIVPAIVGGGGKRGGLLAVVAVAAFAFIALPALAVAGTVATGAGVATSAGTTTLGSKILTNLVINIGLALLSSLFATKPSEENTRQNDMFGSLTNTTSSGVPVAINYGLVRVAGQMINGYVLSLSHGKSQNMNVYGEVYTTDSTSRAQQEETRSDFLSGFNSFT
jgi:predicted phage tail protein